MQGVTLSRMGRPKKDEKTKSLRVPESILKRIKRVAAHLDMDPGDYLKDRIEGPLGRDEKKMLADLRAEQDEAH